MTTAILTLLVVFLAAALAVAVFAIRLMQSDLEQLLDTCVLAERRQHHAEEDLQLMTGEAASWRRRALGGFVPPVAVPGDFSVPPIPVPGDFRVPPVAVPGDFSSTDPGSTR
jgi:hypothetical protein